MMVPRYERIGGIPMAQNNRRSRNAFRKFERMLTRAILGTLVLFLLMLMQSLQLYRLLPLQALRWCIIN